MPGGQRFYLGTYTDSGGRGIASGALDVATGRPEIESWTAEISQPSWLAQSDRSARSDAFARSNEPAQSAPPVENVLYAISELSPDGLVHALAVTQGESPTLLNTQPTGAQPAHLAVHPDGRFLFTALYDGGSIVTHPITEQGTVVPASDIRQHSTDERMAQCHQVVIDPSGQYVLAVDLGLDIVATYRLDVEAARLRQWARTEFPRGSGPRHLVFHPSGEHAYLANELDSTVRVCSWSNGQLLAERVYPTLPPGLTGAGERNYPGEILISADGRFVYLSNRGSDTISIFAVDDDGAGLRLIAALSCGGRWPRHLAIDDTGQWLYVANERSGDVTWFPIDAATGRLGSMAGRLLVTAPAQFLLVSGST